MLKKNDLAKQFELVVKQEIINHNLAIEQSNKRVNELNELINKKNSSVEKSIEILKSSISNLSIDIENIKKHLPKDFDDVKDKLNNIRSVLKSRLDCLSNISIKSDEIEKNLISLANKTAKFEENLNNKEVKIGDIKTHLNDFEKYISEKLVKEIIFLKELLKSKPEQIEDIKCCLDHHKDEYSTEIAGLKREIYIIKKNNFIKEKHIENLYTQIERLKEGK